MLVCDNLLQNATALELLVLTAAGAVSSSPVLPPYRAIRPYISRSTYRRYQSTYGDVLEFYTIQDEPFNDVDPVLLQEILRLGRDNYRNPASFIRVSLYLIHHCMWAQRSKNSQPFTHTYDQIAAELGLQVKTVVAATSILLRFNAVRVVRAGSNFTHHGNSYEIDPLWTMLE